MRYLLILLLLVITANISPLAITASAQSEKGVEYKTIPKSLHGDIRLLSKSKTEAPDPSEDDTVTIGTLREDHFTLHGRSFKVSFVQDMSDSKVRWYQIVGKADAEGGYSLTIVQPVVNRSPSKTAALIISYYSRTTVETEDDNEGYVMLMK